MLSSNGAFSRSHLILSSPQQKARVILGSRVCFSFSGGGIQSHLCLSRIASPTHKLYSFEKRPTVLCFKCMSSNVNQHSFTVSYLINSCGLSRESALSASKRVRFDTPDKPDSVIGFFKNQGFSQTQITKLVKKQPTVLVSDTEKTLLPKLEFFHSKGASSPDIARILSGCPNVLKRSLEKQIIPSFNFFNNLFQSEEKTVAAIKRFTGILNLTNNPETYVAPKIKILRENGVPESNFVTVLHYHPRTILMSADKFKEVMEEVKNMRFNPLRPTFVTALFALMGMSKSTWERKVDVYKRWGWSENEIFEAFGRNPRCMITSEDKIMAIMDFVVNKLGFESSTIAKHPVLITLSLEKRIIPRGSVVQALLSKGLIKKDFRLSTLFGYPENVFLNKFVKCYDEEAPQLLKLYKEKLDLAR